MGSLPSGISGWQCFRRAHCASTRRILGARCFQNGHFGRISSTLYFTVFRSFGGHGSARRVSLEPCFRQAHCFVQGPLHFLPVPPNPTCARSHIWGFLKIVVTFSVPSPSHRPRFGFSCQRMVVGQVLVNSSQLPIPLEVAGFFLALILSQQLNSPQVWSAYREKVATRTLTSPDHPFHVFFPNKRGLAPKKAVSLLFCPFLCSCSPCFRIFCPCFSVKTALF